MMHILFYSNNAKPAARIKRFYDAHRQQAERLGLGFRAVVFEPIGEGDIIAPHGKAEWPYFSGIFRNLLLGMMDWRYSDIVYLAEDDCLSTDARFEPFPYKDGLDPLDLVYPMRTLYIAKGGFFRKPAGWNLGFSYGTVAAMRHNFEEKMREILGHRNRPATSVEPVRYGDHANECYRTCNVNNEEGVNLDFRGASGDGMNSTWGHNGEELFAEHPMWGRADDVWQRYVAGKGE